MPLTIAIVGRPNVGKSTLFNRLAGKRLALVDDQPGLTRDRREADAELGATAVRLIDTAGLEHGHAGLTARMREQTVAAIKQADLIVFLIDARAGIVAADEIFAELVRASGKPVIVAANKCEGRAAEPGVYEAFSLGLGEPLPISAEHDLGIGDLSDAIQQAARDRSEGAAIERRHAEEEEAVVHPLRIAVVGRPNVGKSTLVNTILGEERMITGPEAGITRDAIAVDLERQGRALRLFDTAGLRRKMRMEGTAEELSVGDTLRAIRFAEVVVLLLDAERTFEKQDLQIADLIVEEGRALVIAVNKWDLVRAPQARLAELRETCERLLPQIKGVAFVPVSALTGKGIDKLMGAVLAADELWNKRLPTHALNQWLREAVEAHSPPAVSGRRIKLRYITESNARPPTFVLFCSRPKALPDSYVRYLVNSLRETFGLPGVPIRLHLRKGENPYAKER
ncbi:ribosome biogenesis GTPase Der [Methyloceanibacter sp.]|uniref:ribosome biogenesis GTPase Der n=1 Tax=Methyloceanibacter sp. TaxID=1965321 RepID=UPI003D6D000C